MVRSIVCSIFVITTKNIKRYLIYLPRVATWHRQTVKFRCSSLPCASNCSYGPLFAHAIASVTVSDSVEFSGAKWCYKGTVSGSDTLAASQMYRFYLCVLTFPAIAFKTKNETIYPVKLPQSVLEPYKPPFQACFTKTVQREYIPEPQGMIGFTTLQQGQRPPSHGSKNSAYFPFVDCVRSSSLVSVLFVRSFLKRSSAWEGREDLNIQDELQDHCP